MFDGLFFPLLALDALIVAVDLMGRSHEVPSRQEGVTMLVRNIPGSVVLLLLAIIIVVDFLIICAVWRAMNKSSVQNGAAAPAAQLDAANPQLKPTLILHAVLFVLIGLIFLVGIPWCSALISDLRQDGFPVETPLVPRFGIEIGRFTAQLLPIMFGVDVAVCFLARKLGGRRGLRCRSGFR